MRSKSANFWTGVAVYHRQSLAETTPLAMMIVFAVSWSVDAVIKIVQYLKQRKQSE
jgi:hypothetical protein